MWSVISSFAAVSLLICIAAGLSYSGIENIHSEAARPIHSLLNGNPTQANIDRLIAVQSHRLLDRVESLLGICELSAIGVGALAIWAVRLNLRKIATQSEELSLLSWRLSQEHEIVARRLSHEVHDEFGQMLVGLRMMLLSTPGNAFEWRRPECLAIVDEALESVRELSHLLRPVILDDFGLDEALRWLAQRLEDQTQMGIAYTSQFHGRLPEEVETNLFRIAQESLTNVIRHAQANRAEIHLASNDNWVSLRISDDGVGFPAQKEAAPTRKGLGLVGMKARIRNLGGVMKVENQLGRGVSLFFSVPCTAGASPLEPVDA